MLFSHRHENVYIFSICIGKTCFFLEITFAWVSVDVCVYVCLTCLDVIFIYVKSASHEPFYMDHIVFFASPENDHILELRVLHTFRRVYISTMYVLEFDRRLLFCGRNWMFSTVCLHLVKLHTEKFFIPRESINLLVSANKIKLFV